MPAFNAIGASAVGDAGASSQQTGDAVAPVVGVSATASAGMVTASGAAAGTGTAASVSATASAAPVVGSGGATGIAAGASAAAGVGTVTATVGAALATQVTVRVVDAFGNPRASIAGLKWAFFDQSTVDTLNAPTAKGTNGTTDGAGNLTLNITGTTLQPGHVGILAFSNGNGDVEQTPAARAFIGPVVVA
jgi:hypothetical protein